MGGADLVGLEGVGGRERPGRIIHDSWALSLFLKIAFTAALV